MAENQTPPVEGDPTPTPDPTTPEGAPPEGDDLQPLPEDGPVDLHTVKERNRELAQLRARNRELEEAQETQRKAALSEQEKAIEDAKAAGYAEAESVYKSKLLQSRIYALAVGDFADPGDVHRFLDLDGIDSDISENDLSKELRKLLEDKPYLAAKADLGRIPAPPQGPRGTDQPAAPKDWLRDMIQRK